MDAFELLRHRLRGTRARSSDTAPNGTPSCGELWSELSVALSTSGLPQLDASIVRAFYGLSGYPADLGSVSSLGLVGDVGRRGAIRPMSRSSLTARRKLARELTVTNLPPGLKRDFAPTVEPDPMTDKKLLAVFNDLALSEGDVAKLLAAALTSASDWVDEARSAEALQAALIAWGRRHEITMGRTDSTVSYRQEHRNTANAVMSICLWRMMSDSDLLDTCMSGTPTAVWQALPDLGTGLPLVAELQEGDRVDSAMSAADLLKLVDDVHHQRDESGKSAALAIEMFRSGRARDLLGTDEGSTIWMLGYGLGGSGSWAIVELARWYALSLIHI